MQLSSTPPNSLLLYFMFMLLSVQGTLAQNITSPTQQFTEIYLIDSTSNQVIPYTKFLVSEYNPHGDSLTKNGFTNEAGYAQIKHENHISIQFASKFFAHKKVNKLVRKSTIFLVPIQELLPEIVVHGNTLYGINKIELPIKKLPKSLAPITQNFIKTMHGINPSQSGYTYLGKKIRYSLDGIMAEAKIMQESNIETFEKLEIITSPDGNYWMKPDEVIFNFISKKTKNPVWGIQSNSELALNFPYRSQHAGIYYLGKKVSFRASSVYYSYNQQTSSETTQKINTIQSEANRQLNATTRPNFNSLILNYQADSLTTISYHLNHQNIHSAQISDFSFSSLTNLDLPISTSNINRIYNQSNLGNLLLIRHKEHKLFIRHEASQTENLNQYTEANNLTQKTIENSKSSYINYANKLELTKNLNLLTTLSWENKNATTQFESTGNNTIESHFQANFLGLKSSFMSSYKKVSYLIGARLDLINQNFNTLSTSYSHKNVFRFLPTLSIQFEIEKLGNFQISLNSDYTLPDISQLATFARRLDPYRNIQGNNDLSIENSYSFDLSHSTKVKRTTITSNFGYSETNEYLNYSPYLVINNQLISRYTNLGKQKNISLQMNTSFPASKRVNVQMGISQKYVQFDLNPTFNYPSFNQNWLPAFSITNSLDFQLSKNLSTSMSTYFTTYSYEFYTRTSNYIPSMNLSLNGTFGKEWYFQVNWNTIFSNANRSKIETIQPQISSTSSELNNFHYISIAVQKSFGKKYNNVPVNSTADEVKRSYKSTQ